MSQNKLLRVTQMNAVYLDNEIYKTFQQLMQDCYKYLPPGFTAPYDNEINLFVKLAILNYSVVKQNSTFGQQLLSIKYNNITAFKKILYVAANCLEYIDEKFNLERKYFKLYATIKILNFLNMSIFLRNGVKPLLIERILGLDQVYATENATRYFDSKYLARELLWNGFIEIFVYILPLINYHKITRTFRNYNPFRTKPSYSSMSNQVITVQSKCVHCKENPILPHHMGCEHVFCYVCLKGNQKADSRYECPICEHTNRNIMCERVTVM